MYACMHEVKAKLYRINTGAALNGTCDQETCMHRYDVEAGLTHSRHLSRPIFSLRPLKTNLKIFMYGQIENINTM